MANQEHVHLLKSGVDKWNEWRKENPHVWADLQGADLRRADLQGADLQGAELQGAYLLGRGTHLQGANLQGAYLQGAYLLGANLQEANLQGANLQGADLQGADLQGANLLGANLQGADLQGANLLGANLRWANLEGAYLVGAYLIGAYLEDAYLVGANFTDKRPETNVALKSIAEEKVDNVNFSAYYPPQLLINKETNILVFVYASENINLIQAIAQDYFERQGTKTIDKRNSRKKAIVKHGTPLTITLECEEIEFDPLSITKKWKGEYLSFEFSFTPSKVGALTIHATVHAYGIEIATIENCIITVSESLELSTPENIYAKAKTRTSEGYLRNAIFVSYSRKDKRVAENFRLAQQAIGNDIFMDVHSLRAGESWQAEIAKAIDKADIFQLFWSKNSASSDFVRYEWEYALKHKCQETDCVGFIRPVFWRKTLPASPPKELEHLNFKYIPLESSFWEYKLVLASSTAILILIGIVFAYQNGWF